jgi:hypothetical protein
LSLFLSLTVCRPSSLLPEGGGERVGVESKSNHTTARKPGPPLIIINHSICSGVHHPHVTCQQICDRKHCHPNPTYKKTRVLYIGPADWKRNMSYETQNIYNYNAFYNSQILLARICKQWNTFRQTFFSANWSSLDVSCICFLTVNFFL